MLTARIIPCLDVSHGRVVKGIRFQGLSCTSARAPTKS
jgi:imidazole glycerol-phosphate synthase subunit HisF